MREFEDSVFYREDLVFSVKTGILLLNDLEISDVVFAVLDKYRRMFPDWEIMLLSVKKGKDPMITYSRFVELLQQHERSFAEEKENASLI